MTAQGRTVPSPSARTARAACVPVMSECETAGDGRFHREGRIGPRRIRVTIAGMVRQERPRAAGALRGTPASSTTYFAAGVVGAKPATASTACWQAAIRLGRLSASNDLVYLRFPSRSR